MVTRELCAKRLVFVDEMGSNTSLHELNAYSQRGERAYCSVARNRGKNTTLLSSMTFSGMGPSMVVEGVTNGAVFEGYPREMLVPALREGDVVVMDNLSVHKSEPVRELIEGAGAQVLYLPPYSPDFNPIEEAFSKTKNLVRKAQARTRGALVEAIASRSRRSRSKTCPDGSPTAATTHRINTHEYRCRSRPTLFGARRSQRRRS